MWRLPESRIPTGFRQIGPGEQIQEGDRYWSSAGKWERCRSSERGLIINEKSGTLWIRQKGLPTADACASVISDSLGPVVAELLRENALEGELEHDLLWEIATSCHRWKKEKKE